MGVSGVQFSHEKINLPRLCNVKSSSHGYSSISGISAVLEYSENSISCRGFERDAAAKAYLSPIWDASGWLDAAMPFRDNTGERREVNPSILSLIGR